MGGRSVRKGRSFGRIRAFGRSQTRGRSHNGGRSGKSGASVAKKAVGQKRAVGCPHKGIRSIKKGRLVSQKSAVGRLERAVRVSGKRGISETGGAVGGVGYPLLSFDVRARALRLESRGGFKVGTAAKAEAIGWQKTPLHQEGHKELWTGLNPRDPPGRIQSLSHKQWENLGTTGGERLTRTEETGTLPGVGMFQVGRIRNPRPTVSGGVGPFQVRSFQSTPHLDSPPPWHTPGIPRVSFHPSIHAAP